MCDYVFFFIETGRLDPSSVQEVTSCLLEISKSISVDCQVGPEHYIKDISDANFQIHLQ